MNEPAFPQQVLDPRLGNHRASNGMSLRDYFAAKAMIALANQYEFNSTTGRCKWADMAYAMADAMMEARAA